MNIHAAAVVALAALLAVGCADQPAAPTPPVIAPAPPAVSVEIEPTTARVGEVVTFNYRLSRALDDDLKFWTEATPPRSLRRDLRHRRDLRIRTGDHPRRGKRTGLQHRLPARNRRRGLGIAHQGRAPSGWRRARLPTGGTWTVLP